MFEPVAIAEEADFRLQDNLLRQLLAVAEAEPAARLVGRNQAEAVGAQVVGTVVVDERRIPNSLVRPDEAEAIDDASETPEGSK